jgi:pimeloyl-ACP methyl ester carboxylesterase
MDLQIKEQKGFKYIDSGSGENMILLHGLFGALSNWNHVMDKFSANYRVIIPLLPIYEMPLRKAGIDGLLKFVEDFLEAFELNDITLIGNSLGGHIALEYAIKHQENLKSLVLTGSSGLFENTMGGSYPKRGSYEYMKDRIEHTFYDPSIVDKPFVDNIIDITRDIPKCLRIVAIAKSAQRHNLAAELPKIQTPTLLIWGLNDTITPPMVAHEFNQLIPNSTLRFIDKCSHAPMMEHPEKFNDILEQYLQSFITV